MRTAYIEIRIEPDGRLQRLSGREAWSAHQKLVDEHRADA